LSALATLPVEAMLRISFIVYRGFPKTSVFGKATLDLDLDLEEKADFWPLFPKPFPKLTEFWEWLYSLPIVEERKAGLRKSGKAGTAGLPVVNRRSNGKRTEGIYSFPKRLFFFCVIKRQLCFLGKYLRNIPFRFSMLPFSQLW
jgi:hypothetical protein